MPLPPPLPRCRPVVLGDGASPAELSATLLALLEDEDVDRPIEVFAVPLEAAALPVESASLRWHPPESDLRAALAQLPDLKGDLAWVVAGVRMPRRGLHRLQTALHAEPRIGTASPLCTADPLYSPLEPGGRLPMVPAETDAWLEQEGPHQPVELPAPLACCGVLRAGARAALAANASPAGTQWPLLLARAGWVHVACARVLVDAPAGASAAPGPTAGSDRVTDISLLGERRYWRDAHPLTGLRRALLKVGARADALPQPSLPSAVAPIAVRLHVAHSWGGGLSTWVKDFCDADDGVENLVLRSIGVVGAFGQRLALYRGSESVEPLRLWELGVPIHASAITHLQYRAVLREIAADFGIDCVIVSSLIGHSLDALRTGLPTLLVAHDHYPFCIAIFAFHDGECRSCDRARLDHCIANNPGHRFFRGAQTDDWVALREAFCASVREEDVTIVAPSPSVRDRWCALMPALADARFEVVPHGLTLAPAVAFEPPHDGPLRLIKLGRLSMEKGGEILEAILPELGDFAHLTLLGCGEDAQRLARRPGIDTIASFSRDELPALIARARPHLGLQLSIVPETFSYTLSELWHCGVPVLATRTGSLADRIRDGENGYLIEANRTSVLMRLREVAQARDALAEMRARLLDAPTRTNEQMVADYRTLLQTGPKRRWPVTGKGIAATAHADRESRSGRIALGPISVDPEVTYLRAARAFARYTLDKAAHSPRLPRAIRRLIGGH